MNAWCCMRQDTASSRRRQHGALVQAST
jgi:hypothetical protein